MFFCKYSAPRLPAHGHRGGIRYEARVYADILSGLPLSTPILRAAAAGDATAGDWLILDYLGGPRLSDVYDRMPQAAEWLAEFHSHAVQRGMATEHRWLATYDWSYYVGWSDRTVAYAAEIADVGGWLPRLAKYYVSRLHVLLEAVQTVIHGEFTIHNVMLDREMVVPTDWESAAIGAGEIDFMCLVDRWPSAVVDRCLDSYMAKRWPDGVPEGTKERLQVAELYLHFRWLGENSELMLGQKRFWRFERLRQIARAVGLEG
jgi:hypothetical protein